ncbi:MAG: hypothetical protein HC781_06955 [Leptolyngbyaceae cyanobacterium CSU_1_4]|nr:hypothetical protein [Leptolyngbyaceae cyanobacterium CSU_1_4]
MPQRGEAQTSNSSLYGKSVGETGHGQLIVRMRPVLGVELQAPSAGRWSI